MQNEPIEFESIVIKIFEANSIEVLNTRIRRGIHQIDFIATYSEQSWAVEVKYYRSREAQPGLLYSAAAWLHQPLGESEGLKGILVVSSVVSVEFRKTFEDKFGIILIDRSDLIKWCQSNAELLERLLAVLEPPEDGQLAHAGRDVSDAIDNALTIKKTTPPPSTGADLCTELGNLKPGRKYWRQHEQLCEKILRYLFNDDLSGWFSQKRTTDNSNSYDLVCRLRPTTEFWKFIISDIKSRYVVFEFKNYSAKIKQSQMLTTEKYLMIKGLRKVAIILTRKGYDKGAKNIAQGAMRESGKLLIVIDDSDICTMLDMKDKGNDPSDYLFDKADTFLLSLPR